MKIVIDDKSGFCFGVVRAISQAEELLLNGKKVFSLGDIVHNRVEVNRLEQLGLKTVSIVELDHLSGETVLIRAHGEPPPTYKKAMALGINISDATCPVVAKLQERVLKVWHEMQQVDGQLLILGKRGHAEVVGLAGQIENQAIIIEGIEDLNAVDFNRPIHFLSQTTQSLTLFAKIKNEIIKRAENKNITISDTICRQVSNRSPHLQEFSTKFDIIIFVSGIQSSNGKVLFEVCKSVNPKSYKIEDETELKKEWFGGAKSVGICGATSTPKWIMERVAKYIKEQKWGDM